MRERRCFGSAHETEIEGAAMISTYGVVKAWRDRHITGNEALEMSGISDVANLAEMSRVYGFGPREERPERRRRVTWSTSIEQPRAKA